MRFPKPEQHENYQRWEFLEAAYSGKEYFNEFTLPKHSQHETSAEYEGRKALSTYVNFTKSIQDLYQSHLYAEKPRRKFNQAQDLVDLFTFGADRQGNDYQSVFEKAALMAGIKGLCYVLIDSPKKEEAGTVQNDLDNGIYPYFRVIEPEKVTLIKDYDRWPILQSAIVYNGERKIDGKKYDIFIEYTPTLWVKYRQAGANAEEIERGEHGLGEVPIVEVWSQTGLEGGLSDIDSVADINLEIARLDSMLAGLQKAAGFPMLIAPDESEMVQKGKLEVGAQVILPQPSGSDPYSYLEPNHNSYTAMLTRRKMLEDNLRAIAKVSQGELSKSAISAEALKIMFRSLNALLCSKARNMQRVELDCLRIGCKYIDIVSDAEIIYPESFAVESLSSELDAAMSSMAIVPSKTFKEIEAMRVAEMVNRDLTEDQKRLIQEELKTDNLGDLLGN